MPIENVIATTENCRYCLMCRHTAPVMFVTKKETDSPHGLGLLVQSEKRGLIEWTAEAVDDLYRGATDDGVARANCVTDQPYSSAIAAARAEVAAAGLAPAAAVAVNEALEANHNPYGEKVDSGDVGQGDVALFVGDDAHFLQPDILNHALALLDSIGIQPVLIGRGRSNGLLASSLGYPQTAEMLVQATADDVAASGASLLLTLSPADYYAFGRMNDDRLGVAWPDGLALQDLSVFLSEKIGEIDSPMSVTSPFAYLDPSQAVRAPERHAPVRNIVDKSISGERLNLFWREGRAHPTGHGAIGYTHPEVAEMLSRARLEDAQSVGAQIIFTEAAGDLTELSKYAEEYNVEVVSLYQVLAQQLAGVSAD